MDRDASRCFVVFRCYKGGVGSTRRHILQLQVDVGTIKNMERRKKELHTKSPRRVSGLIRDILVALAVWRNGHY